MKELIAGLAASFARAAAVAAGTWLTKVGFEQADVDQIQLGITALIVSGVLVSWRHVAEWLKTKAADKGAK